MASARRHQTIRFRNTRERSIWLIATAAAAAASWAIAKVLEWPVGIQATLAGLAALVVVVIPELRLRFARSDKVAQTLMKVPLPNHGTLPRVNSLSLSFFGVHEAQTSVPYIDRDTQKVVDPALRAREPLLIVGHSMAGKTRLAAEALKRVLPEAPLLPPPTTSILRTLVDDGLRLEGVVIWFDDLEIYLKGDNGLDLALLNRIVADGAIVVATIRRNELNNFRPVNDDHPEQWKVIERFRQAPLLRQLSATEVSKANERIADPRVLEAMQRYGLAEYLGGGPDAIARFEDGDVTQPIGYALVRAAVDWQRTGRARLISLEDLKRALPGYLETRPDVSTNDEAIAVALNWATQRINETVSLLRLHEQRGPDADDVGRFYEAFDYVVDVVVERSISSENREFPIPIVMWQIATSEASVVERSDVARAADRYFIPRSAIMAQLAAWLSSSDEKGPAGVLLTGVGGSGKTTVLRQLHELWTRLASPQNVGGTISHPSRNLVPATVSHLELDDLDVEGFGARLCASLGIAPFVWGPQPSRGAATRRFSNYLRDALIQRGETILVTLDNLEASRDMEAVSGLLVTVGDVARPAIRMVVATRGTPSAFTDWLIIPVGSPSEDELTSFLRQHLRDSLLGINESPAFLEDVVRWIADRSGGNLLAANLLSNLITTQGAPSIQELDRQFEEANDRLGARLADALPVQLDVLGDDRAAAIVLLKVLSGRYSPMEESDLLQELEGAHQIGRAQSARALRALQGFGVLERSKSMDDESCYAVHEVVRRSILEHLIR